MAARQVQSADTSTHVGGTAGDLMIHALFLDRAEIARGNVICLRPKPRRADLFDAETQLRIG